MWNALREAPTFLRLPSNRCKSTLFGTAMPEHQVVDGGARALALVAREKSIPAVVQLHSEAVQSAAPRTRPVVLPSPAARGAFQPGILCDLSKKVVRHTPVSSFQCSGNVTS